MTVRILEGDCREVLKGLPDESVHCVVSSPPYWRQRDYGMAGQLGLEQTPEEYIDKLTAIFAECRRILKADGTCWVNLGDKWASGGNGGGGSYMADRGEARAHAKNAKGWRNPPAWFKDKVEDYPLEDMPGPCLVTFVHAHVDTDAVLKRLGNKWVAAYTNACCNPETQLGQMDALEEGEDWSILSPGRAYKVLVNPLHYEEAA